MINPDARSRTRVNSRSPCSYLTSPGSRFTTMVGTSNSSTSQ